MKEPEINRLLRDHVFARKVSNALGSGRSPVTVEHYGRRFTFTRRPPHTQRNG